MELITLALILGLVILSGLLSSARRGGLSSYVNADGRLPWPMAGLSLFMSFFSAGTFVAWGSLAYKRGWVAVIIQETICLAGLAVAFWLAARWRRTGAATAAEYLSGRYGTVVRRTYSFLYFLMSVFSAGAFLYPVARLVSVWTGFPLGWCIAGLGLACVTYVSLGGLWSVAVTDVIQFIVLLVATFVAVPLSLKRVGGITALMSSLPASFLRPVDAEYTGLFLLFFLFYNAIHLGGNWGFVQKYLSVRSERDARRGVLLFSLLYLVFPILWMLPSMAYRLVAGPGAAGEDSFVLMCRTVLPSVMFGVMLAGMVFASFSSINAMLTTASSVVANDFVKPLKPELPDSRLLWIARVTGVAFGVQAIVVALLVPSMGGIVNVIITLAALAGTPLYLPVIWSLFSKRLRGWEMLSVTLISLLVNCFFKFLAPGLLSLRLDRTWEIVLGVGFPFLLLSLLEIRHAIKQSISL